MRKTLLNLILIMNCWLLLSPVESVSLLDGGGIRNNSLSRSPRGFIESFIAKNVGDVITVRVIENIESIKNSEMTLNNDVRSDANLIFQMAMTVTDSLTPDTNSVSNMLTNFALPANYSRRNLKDISVNNKEQFTALVSCLVVEIDPESGNMIIEGSRQILMEGETKSLYIRGIIFPKDIDSNNEVPSYKLANAQVQIIGTGALTKERDSGVIQKIFRKLF